MLAKARRDLQRVVDKGVTDSINAAADCCAETLKVRRRHQGWPPSTTRAAALADW